MTKRFIPAIALAALLCAGPAHPASSPLVIGSCAVLPFEGGQDWDMAHNIGLLTERYSQYLTELGAFPVKPLAVTRRTLTANLIDANGAALSLNETLAAGELLGVTHVIRGRVDYGNDQYTLRTTLIDVRQRRAVRAAQSKYKGSIRIFVARTPQSNAAVLLEHLTPRSPAATTDRGLPQAAQPESRAPLVPARTPPPNDETSSDDRPPIHPLWTWRWPRNRADEAPAPPKPERMQRLTPSFLIDRLTLGARITTFSLDTTSGSFIGTINGLDAEQSRVPALYADWLFTRYVGVELTWDKVEAITKTYAHAASDGSVVMKGPILSVFGRYPLEFQVREHTVPVTPYAGFGLAFLSSDFNAEGWWHYGFDTPEQYNAWVATYGSSRNPNDGYHRTMTLSDDVGLVFSAGCAVTVWKRLGVDLHMRIVETETDASFERAYDNGNSGTVYGHFPMSHTVYGLGAVYSF